MARQVAGWKFYSLTEKDLLSFTSTEFLFTGTTTAGVPTRVTLPDGAVFILTLSLQDPEGRPLTLSKSEPHVLRD